MPLALVAHLKNWAADMFDWGSDTEIEIRIVRPARRNRKDYFKNVEADLLRWFGVRYRRLPMITGHLNRISSIKDMSEEVSPTLDRRSRNALHFHSNSSEQQPSWQPATDRPVG